MRNCRGTIRSANLTRSAGNMTHCAIGLLPLSRIAAREASVGAGDVTMFELVSPTYALADQLCSRLTGSLPGFYLSAWQALGVSKHTPRNAIDRLNAAVVGGLD
jgi:hypothetical protein